jgi:hypothetical protein
MSKKTATAAQSARRERALSTSSHHGVGVGAVESFAAAAGADDT